MINQHPLTDEIIGDIWKDVSKTLNEVSESWLEDKLMRAAADWQLERVIKYISITLMDAYLYVDDSRDYAFNEGEFLKDLEKAMRPQVVDLPQANSDVCGEEGMRQAQKKTFEENQELLRKLSNS